MNEKITEDEYLEIKRKSENDIKLLELDKKSTKERLEASKKLASLLPTKNKEYKKVYELNLLFPNNKEFEAQYKKLKLENEYHMSLLQMKKLEIKTYGKYIKEKENMKTTDIIDLDYIDGRPPIEAVEIGTVRKDKTIDYKDGEQTSMSYKQILGRQNDADLTISKEGQFSTKAIEDMTNSSKEKISSILKTNSELSESLKSAEEKNAELEKRVAKLEKELAEKEQALATSSEINNTLTTMLEASEEKRKAYEEALKEISSSLEQIETPAPRIM